MSTYETIIGIETHVQLSTKSKLFCACSNDSRMAKPNTNVCPVCLGFPGALPVLNEQAVKLTLRAGMALNAYADIKKFHAKFDRKNYFYPDSPMNYQITQFDEPLIGNGYVEFPVEGTTKRVGVTRAHLEADAGKLIHPSKADYSLVDLNRAGTPLLEIVSEPDMRSAAEAKAYAQEIYNLMRYAEVSDADLYYGNMRFDVNVSLRPAGSKELGTRTESKNLNSFRAVAGVVEYETKRQAEILDRGDKVIQETRGWDENKNQTFSQRGKEEAHDYRYFPEPDLPPLEITAAMLDAARVSLPDSMPDDVRQKSLKLGLSGHETETMIADPAIATKFFDAYGSDKKVAAFVGRQLTHEPTLRDAFTSFSDDQLAGLRAAAEATLATAISGTQFKQEIPKIIAGQKLAFKAQISDSSALEVIVDQVIADNPKPVAEYKAGEEKVLGFLVGQVMKASKGQANPPMVNAILKEKLGK